MAGERRHGASVDYRGSRSLRRRTVERASDARLVALIAGRSDAESVRRAETWLACAGGIGGLWGWLASGGSRRAVVGNATRLEAALELARRIGSTPPFRRRLASPDDVAEECRDLVGAQRESIVVLSIDGRGGMVSRETIALGRLNAASAAPGEVVAPALRNAAPGLIVVHNHPSGDPAPSEQDDEFTRVVARASALVGVEFVDHVIVAQRGYISMRATGALDGVKAERRGRDGRRVSAARPARYTGAARGTERGGERCRRGGPKRRGATCRRGRPTRSDR